jgi:hypothetical protein
VLLRMPASVVLVEGAHPPAPPRGAAISALSLHAALRTRSSAGGSHGYARAARPVSGGSDAVARALGGAASAVGFSRCAWQVLHPFYELELSLEPTLALALEKYFAKVSVLRPSLKLENSEARWQPSVQRCSAGRTTVPYALRGTARHGTAPVRYCLHAACLLSYVACRATLYVVCRATLYVACRATLYAACRATLYAACRATL